MPRVGIETADVFPLTGKISGAEIQNETFNFSESYGTTITGDNGTVATINTSAAQAENYTNTEIWQKNDFALKFDAVNSEDLIIDNGTSWNTWGDVYWEITTDVSNVENSNNIFSFGDSVGDKFRITKWSTDNLRAQLNISSQGGQDDLQIPWDSSWSVITIKQENGIIYVDSVAALDFSSRNSENLFSFNDFHFGRLSYSSIWYTNQILHSATIQNETFPLKIGLGNTITGSNGTVATINTSAAQAKDRINFGMWLKGNDVDGWTPYVKD